MALVQYGAGIVQMSGSIAGDVHARNRFGNYIRPRTKPVNPHSTRQEFARANVSYLAEYWHSDMTVIQRNLWNVYAAAVAMKNRLNATIHLTGFNHFIRSMAAAMIMGRPISADAPTILSLAEKDPTLACTEENIAAQLFTFTYDNGGWAPNGDEKVGMLLYQGQPQLASRNFFATPWRYMSYVNGAEGAAGTCNKAAAFAFALGQKVWFQARVMTLSYRLSEPWAIAPRTIEADGP